jgi:hypothetical protein
MEDTLMSDADGISTLTLEQVTELISQAKSAEANPVLVAVQIFNGLGGNVTLPGPTLALALSTSGIPVSPLLVPLLNAIQSISKAGQHVGISLNQTIEVQQKVRVKCEKEMSFDVSDDGGNPSLNNIVGLSGHKGIFGAPVKSIQLSQNQGGWSVAVKTPVKTINFGLH